MIKRSKEVWLRLFAEHEASGLPARQFCLQRQLCSKHFSLRRNQLLGSTAAKSVQIKPILKAKAVSFVQVKPMASSSAMQTGSSSDAFTAVLRHGRSEVVLHAVSPQWLSQLLMALA